MLNAKVCDPGDESMSHPDYAVPGGVRLSVNIHRETLGGHRFRFAFESEVAEMLARGLEHPRLNIHGDCVNGFRIWCAQDGEYAPILNKGRGARPWTVTMPIRRVRGREDNVPTTAVAYEWDRDDTGPVLLIPRVPDRFLPQAVLDKLPNRAVDPETRMERADKRLTRELARVASAPEDAESSAHDASPVPPAPPAPSPMGMELTGDSPALPAQSPASVGAPDVNAISFPAVIPVPRPEALSGDLSSVPALSDPIPHDAAELKEAMAMVNELKERLGDNVVLYIDGDGRVQAKRRVISYIDL